MTKNEFKQGDKVVAKQYYDIDVNGYSTTIPIGEIGVIEDVYDDELLVSFSNYGVSLIRPMTEFEVIQPLDRRTAFLTRLQLLLREYNARIEPYFSVCADIPSIDLYFGNDCVESWDRAVTADNIMDFDKE